ncbi:Type IV pilus biogenesis and competence protein PilQ precursor [compost metagenome]
MAIDTKHIQTQVLVENGGTVVIGGIFEMEETNNETKVPLLGDVPVVGNLFKSRTRETSKREMLVFITPKMLMQNKSAR